VSASTSDAASARACITHLGHLARTGAQTGAAVNALLALSLVPGRLDAAREALLALPPERINDVAQSLRQPSVDVRQRAVSVLSELRHPHATAHVVLALDDNEPVVREAAVAALAQLGARNVEDRLQRLAADDPSAAVRRAAARALASMGHRT
jgi:HEAT repeat protein